MPVQILDEIVRQIVLARAASSGGATGIALRSSEVMLGKAFAGIAPPELISRCAAELHLIDGVTQPTDVLGELTELVLIATERNPAIQQRLEAARSALKRLAAICLLTSSGAASRLELLIDDGHLLDYLAQIVYRVRSQARLVLVGRLSEGDEEILISPDSNVSGLGRMALCYTGNSPWPLLTIAQRLHSIRTGDRLGLQQWAQSSAEADDLILSTTERIVTRLMPVPYTLPMVWGSLQLTAATAVRLVVTRVLASNNAVATIFIRPIDPDTLPSPL